MRARTVSIALGAVALIAASTAACIPLPFASPPIKASIMVGPGGGTTEVAPDQPVAKRAVDTVLGARVGVHPLQLIPSLLSRRYDVGAGYAFETTFGPGLDAPQLHGAYLEGTYWFGGGVWQKAKAALRVGLVAEVDILWSTGRDRRPGFGVTAGLTIELTQVTAFGFSSSDSDSESHSHHTHDGRNGPIPEPQKSSDGATLIGVGYGEVGIGASLVGGYRRVGAQETWLVVFRLDVRLPATVGIAIIPL